MHRCVNKPRLSQGIPRAYNAALHKNAGIAQLVERNLAKVEVASSRLVSRRRLGEGRLEAVHGPSLFASGSGGVAEWSCSGLQSRVRRFDSDLRLQTPATANRLGAARVVKLVDTRDLKSLGASHAGSIPAPGTKVSGSKI